MVEPWNADAPDRDFSKMLAKAAFYVVQVLTLILSRSENVVVIVLDNCHYFSPADWMLTLFVSCYMKRMQRCFLVFATRPLHLSTQQHAFLALDTSYVKLLQSIHVGMVEINKLSKLEIEHFVQKYSGCEQVGIRVTDFLHRVTGGSIGLLKSVFDELCETHQLVKIKNTCKLTRSMVVRESTLRQHDISVPPKTRRIIGKVFDQLSFTACLLLKCAVRNLCPAICLMLILRACFALDSMT